jgi:hypothetical protein
MIAYSYIEKNLKLVAVKYAVTRDPKELSFLSKIAIIELCGWIEMSMDEICFGFINRNLTDLKYKKELKDKIKNNYGFQYEKHFKNMILHCVGYYGFVKIEKTVDAKKNQLFKSELGSLTLMRNSVAHT